MGRSGAGPFALAFVATAGLMAGAAELAGHVRPAEAGPPVARRVLPPGTTEPAFITKLAAAGGLLFLRAFDAEAGQELWRSNGTAAGTLRVAGPARRVSLTSERRGRKLAAAQRNAPT